MWRLRIVGNQVLIVGATGAGKSAVLWAIIFGLAPLVGARLVEIWAIDPKGEMELAFGRPLLVDLVGAEWGPVSAAGADKDQALKGGTGA